MIAVIGRQTKSYRGIASKGAITLVALILLFGLPIGAQLTSDKALWIHRATFTGNQATVFLSALQANWRSNQEPIMGVSSLAIGSAAFEVYLDKRAIKPVQVQRFSESPEGIDVVLAIDVSGSVYSQYALMQQAVNTYLSHLRAGKDQAAILTFGSDIQTSEFRSQDGSYSAFTDDIAALQKIVNAPPERARIQKTVLYKAVKEAAELAARGRSGANAAEKVVVVLSDGHDEGEGYDISVPIEAAKRNQVPVFSLGAPDPSNKDRYHDVLERMSRDSGAVFVPIRDLNQLQAVYEKLDGLLKNQHVVHFQVPAELQDGQQHGLQVLASDAGTALSARLDLRTPIQGGGTGTTPGAPATAGSKAPATAATPAPVGPQPSWYQQHKVAVRVGSGLIAVLILCIAIVVRRKIVIGRRLENDEDDAAV